MSNNLISVLIVDDEAPAREKLRRYLEKSPQFEVIAEARNGQEALDNIYLYKPQLILLDIQMPGMTGFDVLRLMDTNNSAIIFTTAYDEYAVKAFEVSALDYLLKPIGEQRFHQALDKVLLLMQENWHEKVTNVLQHLTPKNFISRLPVRSGKRTKILNVKDISFIRSEYRLVNVYNHLGEKHWINESLTQLESRLDPKFFMRVHRNCIINLTAQFEIAVWNSGRLKLYFSFEKEAVVSREYAISLKEKF